MGPESYSRKMNEGLGKAAAKVLWTVEVDARFTPPPPPLPLAQSLRLQQAFSLASLGQAPTLRWPLHGTAKKHKQLGDLKVHAGDAKKQVPEGNNGFSKKWTVIFPYDPKHSHIGAAL